MIKRAGHARRVRATHGDCRPPRTRGGWAATLAAALLAACGGGGDGPRADRVVFSSPIELTQARVLSGDPTDDRCPAGSPCFKDNQDILGGQRTIAGIHDVQVQLVSRPVSSNPITGESSTTNESRLVTIPTANSKPRPLGIRPLPNDGVARTGLLGSASVSGRLGGLKEQFLAMTLYDGDGTTGADQYALQIDTETARIRLPVNRSGQNDHALFGAIAAFDGKQPEVAWVAGNQLQVATPTLDQDGQLQNLSVRNAVAIGPTYAMTTAHNLFGAGPAIIAAVLDPTTDSLQVQFFDAPAGQLSQRSADTFTVRLPVGNYVQRGTERLVAGHFTDPTYEQVVLLFDEADRNGKPVGMHSVLISRSTDADGRYRIGGQAASNIFGEKNPTPAAAIAAAKGRALVTDPYESVAVLHDHGTGDQRRSVVTMLDFDADGRPNIAAGRTIYQDEPTCGFGIDTGNFDRKTTAADGTELANRSLQLAVLTGRHCAAGVTNQPEVDVLPLSEGSGGAAGRLKIGALGDADGFAQPIPVNSSVPIRDPIVGLSIHAVDTQARSLYLGPPKVITINNLSQPDVVVAAPPMHADWVTVDGESVLKNLSLGPRGFNSTYATSSSVDSETKRSAAVSWSVSAEESFGFEYALGDCEAGDCASLKNETALKQDVDGSTQSFNSSMTKVEQAAKQTTNLDDFLWYTDSTLTIYSYPILGKQACTPSSPGADCGVPATLLVSGPDTVSSHAEEASSVAWYQPPWVTGNVLSYPANARQLAAAAEGSPGASVASLTGSAPPTTWSLDSTETELETSFATTTGSGNEVELGGNFSANNKTSAYVKAGLGDLASGSAELSVSVGASVGFKNLSDSRLTMSNSSGVSIMKRLEPEQPSQFAYDFQSYIFTDQPPPAPALAAPGAPLQGIGSLRSAFVVNLDTEGNQYPKPFWTTHYHSPTGIPDLALLHPQRMTIHRYGTKPVTGAEACVGVPGGFDCAEEATPSPANMPTDDFHKMRGLFISDDGEGAGKGPLKTSAVEGQKITLQARLHNLSLDRMPANAHVRVAFYGTVWNFDASVNDAVSTFPIGEPVDSTSPIPPYHTDDGTPNWALVSQTFDTTGHAGESIFFWVVIWMEDGRDGPMLVEPNGKGLTAKPTPTMSFAQAAALDDAHGNNVGFLDYPFQVLPKTTVSASAAATPPTKPSLRISEVGTDAPEVRPGEKMEVAARVTVGENDLPNGTKVVFYDGDPAAGGEVIGSRRLGYLRAETTYDFRISFRPRQCGPHSLYVVSGPGTRFEHKVRLRSIGVSCS